jgi:ADP-heptose:LPS heptosyltransferase
MSGLWKRLLIDARAAVLVLLDTFLCLVPAPRPQERRRVLVVRLDRIGDFLLWRAAAQAYRRLYPTDGYELTLLAHPSWAALVRAEGWFDRVETLDVRRLAWSLPYRWRQLGAIRRSGFSVVVQARCARELVVEDSLTRVSGAAERFGFALPGEVWTAFQTRVSDRWYTRLVTVPPEDTNELERNAVLMRGLGLADFQARVAPLAVRASLPEALVGKTYYVLFPGASASGRQWPRENFSALAERIYDFTGWIGLVCGGPGEEALGAALVGQCTAPLQDWAGRTTLTELSALMAGARLVISNETSGVHMAAAVGPPAVCILGGGHFGRFLPYPAGATGHGPVPLPVYTPMDCFGCDWHCRYPVDPGQPYPCLGNVSVEQVWAGVKTVLAATDEPSDVQVPMAGALLAEE